MSVSLESGALCRVAALQSVHPLLSFKARDALVTIS